MASKFFVGLAAEGNSLKITIVDEKGKIIHQNQKKIDSNNGLDTEIKDFLSKEVKICNSSEPKISIAIDHLFEYGDDFGEKLKKQIAFENVQVVPLDATAFLEIFHGITMKADGTVSIAASQNGNTISVQERGHMIGDPGSAYWIANKCLRMIYDNKDGIETTDYDLTLATKAANEYFQMKNPLDILKPLYSDFSKLRITLFCEKLAQLAQRGDNFCTYLFKDAGNKLGKLTRAMCGKGKKDKVDLSQMIKNDYLEILGVGRIWNYYELIRIGFIETLQNDFLPQDVKHIKIFQWIGDESYPVALLASKSRIEINYSMDNNFRFLATEIFP